MAEKGNELTDEDGRAFILEVRTMLAEKGIADDQGWRRGEIRKPMIVHKVDGGIEVRNGPRREIRNTMVKRSEDTVTKEDNMDSSSGDEQVNLVRKQATRKERTQPEKQSSGMECYTCGKRGHG